MSFEALDHPLDKALDQVWEAFGSLLIEYDDSSVLDVSARHDVLRCRDLAGSPYEKVAVFLGAYAAEWFKHRARAAEGLDALHLFSDEVFNKDWGEQK